MPKLSQGTGRDDYLQGGNGADVLSARGGNDILSGNGGNDDYYGGTGYDSFWNGAGDGVDTVHDYQSGEQLILWHGGLVGPHHYLADGETFTTKTGEVFEATQVGADAHLEFTAGGVVSGVTLLNTDVSSLFTGWFSWSQGQPDVPGYSMFGMDAF